MDISSAEIKQIFKSIYSLVKTLDDRKANITNIHQLFIPDVLQKRLTLVQRCEILLFEDFEGVGKKSREILWRKGYYDIIATGKKLWKSPSDTSTVDYDEKECLQQLLIDGINRFKAIILNFEKKFNLDLRLLINFKIIDDVDVTVIERSRLAEDEALLADWQKRLVEAARQHELYTVNEKNYTLSTIHALLISLGDFHRYYIDFGFPVDGQQPRFSKEHAAQFYQEAFKLDPSVGMAHNQLGTLYTGRNFDLDSVYHYLQSLISKVPFELSYNNVNKSFHLNAAYLENEATNNTKTLATAEPVNARNLMARLILVIDVFFFDKDVTEFNELCQFVLMDLRALIMSEAETNRMLFTSDLIYKIVTSLFFCLIKLRTQASKKVHSLNAFLVGICLTLVEVCLVNLEQHLCDNVKEIEQFSKRYTKMFDAFDKGIKANREKYRNGLVSLNNTCELKNAVDFIESYAENVEEPPLKNGHEASSNDEKSLSNKENNHVENQVTPKPAAKKAAEPLPPTKVVKKGNLRRRRRRFNDSDSEFEDNSDEHSVDSDSDSNSNSSLSCFDSSDSSENEDEDEENDEALQKVLPEADGVASNADSEDIIIEEEKIIYNNNNNDVPKDVISAMNDLTFTGQSSTSSSDDFVIEEEIIIYPETGKPNGVQNTSPAVTSVSSVDLKYRKMYEKINPNVVIAFVQAERTMKALKVLFDWLRLTPDILVACYVSNPDFIHKIMKLINYFNIDIFTRKVFFERKMLTIAGLRDELVQLFDVRHTIPTVEDVLLKRIPLFDEGQEKLVWETSAQFQVTETEENLLRMQKFVDFGFYLTKMRKFNYHFDTKTRNFIENPKKMGREQRVRNRNRGGRRRDKSSLERNDRSGRQGGGRRRRNRRRKDGMRRRSKDEDEMPPPAIIQQRKGYLKNKSQMNGNDEVRKTSTSNASSNASQSNDETGGVNKQNNKNELMGKLWLRDEVKTLESKMKKPMSVQLTPYVVLDTKSLSEYTSIVKNLVKTKAFVILIPTAVLSELDELKKTSEGVRNAIKWLECEFKKGNRFLRSQRNYETLSLPLIKIKKKLDRESSTFLQIAQFCNHIVTNYQDCDATTTTAATNEIVTLLTGDHLKDRKTNNNFSYTGLLESIPVKYDQIVSFYSNLKKK